MHETPAWPATLELRLDGIAQGGDAVGRWNGRVVFAAGGLPGELVRVRLRERQPAYAHAIVTEILEPAPERVAPRMPGADHMPWQYIAYPAQLLFRRRILADQLARIGGLADVPVQETIPASPAWAYRNNARLHIEGRRAGYHAAGTRTIREIVEDPLLMPPLNHALAALRRALERHPAPPLEARLRLSETAQRIVAELEPAERSPEITRRLAELTTAWHAACPELAGVVYPRGRSGMASITEELAGIRFALSAATFFQVNRAAAEALLACAASGLDLQGTERVLDLYCGVGTFTLPLAAHAAEIIGIEEFADSAAQARKAAEANGVRNARFFAGRVEELLEQLPGRFDAALLDPPRRGCHPRALAALLRHAPRQIVYISCHPATLARDLGILTQGDYRVRSARPVDLFPQTAHVESVAVLDRR